MANVPMQRVAVPVLLGLETAMREQTLQMRAAMLSPAQARRRATERANEALRAHNSSEDAGSPDCARSVPLNRRMLSTARAAANRTVPHSKRGQAKSSRWDLTFDMSGGAKGAKRPLGRPLDGGVRFRAVIDTKHD